MAGGESDDTSLEKTPTYAVAASAATFIALSLLLERGIHSLKKYLKRKNQRPLRKVVDKLTEELMLLGFISLLLTVFQTSVSKICVSPDVAKHMLPCQNKDYGAESLAPEAAHVGIDGHKRRLLAGTASTTCANKGKVPFISTEGLHQLHIFIFVLAIVHVFYSFLTVALGFLRVHHWKKWEHETRCVDYDGKKDLKKRFCDKAICKASGQSFVERYTSHPWTENPVFIWILCFFRQFAGGVSREDYLTFRVGFLHNHSLADTFNFRDYVIRSMEVDFKTVIGISWLLWAFVVVFLLLNINGWYTYFWASFIPLILVLILGAKQQHIIATLALNAKRHALESSESEQSIDPEKQAKGQVADIAGAIKPSDKLFWFNRPKLLLRLLHFVVFQNSFELAFLIWLRASFGSDTCFFGKDVFLPIRVAAGILSQLLASYSTLPTYALISQMGSTMKETVFSKDVQEGLQGWRARAAKKQSYHSSQTDSDTSKGGQNGDVTPGESKQGSVESKEGAVEGTDSQDEHVPTPASRQGPQGTVMRTFAAVNAFNTVGHASGRQAGPTGEFERRCQRYYGKAQGLEKVKAAQKNPR